MHIRNILENFDGIIRLIKGRSLLPVKLCKYGHNAFDAIAEAICQSAFSYSIVFQPIFTSLFYLEEIGLDSILYFHS